MKLWELIKEIIHDIFMGYGVLLYDPIAIELIEIKAYNIGEDKYNHCEYIGRI